MMMSMKHKRTKKSSPRVLDIFFYFVIIISSRVGNFFFVSSPARNCSMHLRERETRKINGWWLRLFQSINVIIALIFIYLHVVFSRLRVWLRSRVERERNWRELRCCCWWFMWQTEARRRGKFTRGIKWRDKLEVTEMEGNLKLIIFKKFWVMTLF